MTHQMKLFFVSVGIEYDILGSVVQVTIQFDILTKTRGFSTDEGGIDSNMFYGRSKEEVLENFEKAKEVYEKIIKCFNRTHMLIHGYDINADLGELVI